MIRICGGSWEQWEDELTMDRLRAIMDSADDLPPAFVTLFAIAHGLGVMPDGKKDAESGTGADAFVAMFGGSGSLTGSM